MGRLNGKIAIVTGAAQSTGLATVKLFVKEGARVTAIDRNKDLLMKEMGSLNTKDVISVVNDVRYMECWEEAIKKTVDAWGKIDILVNNAAILMSKSIIDMSLDEFHETLDNNCTSVFLGMKQCYPFMPKGGNSSIVNISSIGGIVAGPYTSNDVGYHTSKAAVRNLTKHAAYVFASDRIRVNSIHPGGINTVMMKESLANNPGVAASLATNFPLPPHVSEPEDVANAIQFLASDEARTITGIELLVENGFMSI